MTATAKLTDAELERMMYLLRMGRNGDATAEEHQEAEKLLRRVSVIDQVGFNPTQTIALANTIHRGIGDGV